MRRDQAEDSIRNMIEQAIDLSEAHGFNGTLVGLQYGLEQLPIDAQFRNPENWTIWDMPAPSS